MAMEKLKSLYQQIPEILRNKYVLCLAFFIIWMFFFDRNSFVSQIQYKIQLSELGDKIEYYNSEISDVRKDYDALFSDQASIDQFAREKFWMKKPNEEIFLIVED